MKILFLDISKVAFYLQNVHIQPRKIYLSLIAENQEHLCGSGNLTFYSIWSKKKKEENFQFVWNVI